MEAVINYEESIYADTENKQTLELLLVYIITLRAVDNINYLFIYLHEMALFFDNILAWFCMMCYLTSLKLFQCCFVT